MQGEEEMINLDLFKIHPLIFFVQECDKGFYNMTSYGCVSKCGCYLVGSINDNYCNKQTGQCECKVS